MKRTLKSALCLTLFSILLLVGCQPGESTPPPVVPQANQASATCNGLELTLAIPLVSYAPDENLSITITTRNVSDQAIAIVAPCVAPYRVELQHYTGLGWETRRTIPAATIPVRNEWTLGVGETHSLTMDVSVGHDWPKGRPLRIAAWINGLKEPHATFPLHVAQK
jgi:hypothetical protein